jgi:uncharacterized protein (DUF885 family)
MAMYRKYAAFFLLTIMMLSCGNHRESDSIGDILSGTERKTKLELLMAESKRTLDSIDVAYTTIRKESRKHQLSLDEREQVNESLMDLNDAKDLIVLEMEKSVVDELKQKTASLQEYVDGMTTKSEKLERIANTLSRISSTIEKTTNLFADAVSFGIIRPKIVAEDSQQ